MTKFDDTDIKKIHNVISNLIVGNITELGMSMRDAKAAAFNRMMKDESVIFDIYLNQLTT